MYVQAILAPTLTDATPDQRARAHRAMMEQMLLLARGYAVDSSPVRCAAEMVGSAVAPDPAEYEIAPIVGPTAPVLGRTGGSRQRELPRVDAKAERKADWQDREAYKRYLRTIMSSIDA